MGIIPDGRGATSESRPSPPWGGRSGLQTGVHVRDGRAGPWGKQRKNGGFTEQNVDFTMILP